MMKNSVAKSFSLPVRTSVIRLFSVDIACRGVSATSPLIFKKSDTSLNINEAIYPKPFDQVPGLRVLPVIGTAWGMFPHIGTIDFFCQPLKFFISVLLMSRWWYTYKSNVRIAATQIQALRIYLAWHCPRYASNCLHRKSRWRRKVNRFSHFFFNDFRLNEIIYRQAI